MTGSFDAGTHNLNNVGALNGSGALSVSQLSGTALTVGNAVSRYQFCGPIQSGTGNAMASSTKRRRLALTSSKIVAGTTTVSSTGGTTATTLITSNGTSAASVNITSTGANGGITLLQMEQVLSQLQLRFKLRRRSSGSMAGRYSHSFCVVGALKFYSGLLGEYVGTGTGNGDFKADGTVR